MNSSIKPVDAFRVPSSVSSPSSESQTLFMNLTYLVLVYGFSYCRTQNVAMLDSDVVTSSLVEIAPILFFLWLMKLWHVHDVQDCFADFKAGITLRRFILWTLKSAMLGGLNGAFRRLGQGMMQKRSIVYYQQPNSQNFMKIIVALPTMVLGFDQSCAGDDEYSKLALLSDPVYCLFLVLCSLLFFSRLCSSQDFSSLVSQNAQLQSDFDGRAVSGGEALHLQSVKLMDASSEKESRVAEAGTELALVYLRTKKLMKRPTKWLHEEVTTKVDSYAQFRARRSSDLIITRGMYHIKQSSPLLSYHYLDYEIYLGFFIFQGT
ncbi:unnamed protein product [Cochlearia groenlandica]